MTDLISRNRVNPEKTDTTPIRRPEWIKVSAPGGESYQALRQLMSTKHLHTVCEEAGCPNLGECWRSGTATFLILGDVCTRTCKFCDVKHGKPGMLDWDEPARVIDAVKTMQLKHAVITSVNRDERRDGGAPIFAMITRGIHAALPDCSVEVLIPDFRGSIEALNIVLDAQPEILNHNVETVKRLFSEVQPQDQYVWAQTVSGLMVGLGETFEEVKETMQDLRAWGVNILTIGQYLQPSRHHMAIKRYYLPEEFEALKAFGLAIGFDWVESAPLVRSSYHAVDQVHALSVGRQG